jgi:hypothetical protein
MLPMLAQISSLPPLSLRWDMLRLLRHQWSLPPPRLSQQPIQAQTIRHMVSPARLPITTAHLLQGLPRHLINMVRRAQHPRRRINTDRHKLRLLHLQRQLLWLELLLLRTTMVLLLDNHQVLQAKPRSSIRHSSMGLHRMLQLPRTEARCQLGQRQARRIKPTNRPNRRQHHRRSRCRLHKGEQDYPPSSVISKNLPHRCGIR